MRRAPVDDARDLLERLRRENGTVRIENPDEPTRTSYRRAIHAAKHHGLVPAGFHLKHTGRNSGDIIIRLSDDAHPDEAGWNQIRLNVRKEITEPTGVLAALEKDPSGLNVSEAALPRALSILGGLAQEAARRGHRLGVSTKGKRPAVFIKMGEIRRTVTIHEEYDRVPHVPTAQERRVIRRNPWQRTVPEYDQVASGRLQLEVARAGWDKRDQWADSKRSRLEGRLRQVVKDIEAGVASDEQERLAQQRAHEEMVARWEREEVEKRARWQAAMDGARTQAVDKLRKDTFRAALDAWIRAGEIRAFCATLEQACKAADDSEVPQNLERWIAWGRAMADSIDPARGPASLADTEFDIEPEPDDLRLFLGDWSPHRPEREYRSEKNKTSQVSPQSYADSWHPGLRGRTTWWRR